MQHSDEEDDFLSADEDGFDGDQESCKPTTQLSKPEKEKVTDKESDSQNFSNNQVIEGIELKSEAHTENPPCETTSSNKDTSTGKRDVVNSDESVTQFKTSQDDDKANSSASNSSSDELSGTSKNPVAYEEDDDDEEALAERIRERNLKIARKFSAEIAKNLKASAPIPVKTTSSNSQSNRDTDYPTSIPGTPSGNSSFLPPAPPPTPALSSSFSNLNDQTSFHQSSTANVSVAPSQPSMNSQYSWRVPPTSATKTKQQHQQDSGSSSPSTKAKIGGGEDQARQVLDRLAEKLSHTDKNLFERVTEDIKKVSIKNEEIPSAGSNVTSQLPPLSSITDLGSTLGGWGWSGATKLLSSASQVTSHVGSVLDSVLLPEERVIRTEQAGGSGTIKQQPPMADGKAAGATTEQRREINSTDGRDEDGTAMPGDPLVDFTLSAMESLGKKAFGVMTTRDQSGSLQIKGLGRPWEHLLNTRRTNGLDVQSEGSDVQDDVQKNQRRPRRPSRSPSPPAPSGGAELFDTFEQSGSLIEQNRTEIDKPQLPSTLKNRRKQRYDKD